MKAEVKMETINVTITIDGESKIMVVQKKDMEIFQIILDLYAIKWMK